MRPSERLTTLVSRYLDQFTSLSDDEWSFKPGPEKWSKKEILGHLCDSAQNNLRRFVVAQYEEQPRIVYYQDEWVAYQCYQDAPIHEVITLWKLLNHQVARTIEAIPREKLPLLCDTGKKSIELHSLEFLIEDYIVHHQHHLKQIVA